MRAYVFRFAPESGHCATQPACPFRANNGSRRSIDDLVCTTKQGGRNFETERLRGLQIDLPPWRSRPADVSTLDDASAKLSRVIVTSEPPEP